MKKVHYAVILQSQLGPRSGEIFLQEDLRSGVRPFCAAGRAQWVFRQCAGTGEISHIGISAYPGDSGAYDAILTAEEGRLYGGLITRHGCWEVTGVLSGESGHPAETEL